MGNTDGIEVWNRNCKTKDCHGLARINSNYCIRCRNKIKEKMGKIK